MATCDKFFNCQNATMSQLSFFHLFKEIRELELLFLITFINHWPGELCCPLCWPKASFEFFYLYLTKMLFKAVLLIALGIALGIGRWGYPYFACEQMLNECFINYRGFSSFCVFETNSTNEYKRTKYQRYWTTVQQTLLLLSFHYCS